MTNEPAPERGSGPGRLWTDPREEEEHQQWLAPKTVIMPAPPLREPHDEQPDEPPRRRLWPLILAATAVAVGLFGIGVLGANLLFNHDEPSRSVSALPAASGSVAPSTRSRVARLAGPSVVLVRVQEGGSRSSGTGFLIDSNGTIVTAAHVVDGAKNVTVRFKDNGDNLSAEVLGRDESSDLAVLRVDASKTDGIRPLVLADSNSVQVGDPAIAIGYPLGLDRTVTAGIVSGVGRAIKATNGFSIDKVIQTDASINPGNSGGPLLDGAGRVIGVNSQIATTNGGGGNIGIGFAVPSNTVREVVPRLEQGAPIKRAYLGVSTQDAIGTGALVADVVGGGPADTAGLQIGDLITKAGGADIKASEDISSAIEGRKPGDRVDLEVERAGDHLTLGVTLGTRPQSISTP